MLFSSLFVVQKFDFVRKFRLRIVLTQLYAIDATENCDKHKPTTMENKRKQTIRLLLECKNKMEKEYYRPSFDLYNERKQKLNQKTFIILMKRNLRTAFCPVVNLFVIQIIPNQQSNGI